MSPPLRHLIRSLLLFTMVGAVLAVPTLQHAAPVAAAQRAEAVIAAERATLTEQVLRTVRIQLVAAARCTEGGRIPLRVIDASFGLTGAMPRA